MGRDLVLTLLAEQDRLGHLLLRATARAQRVRHFSTAVVCGKPFLVPIDEDHPLQVPETRKPVYRMAKKFAGQQEQSA